jgi:transposase InsO family protein
MVESCRECAKLSWAKKEPLIPTPLPDYPWQLVGTDLFELNQKHYLLVVDYFSRYLEVLQLSSTTPASVITTLKTIFARHGILEILCSDNGPQYSSGEFVQFTSSYGLNHVTSSPRYAQSNGEVERAVRTIKAMLKKSKDLYIAVLSYRATPIPWCARSPAELRMGCKIRSRVTQMKSLLIPQWSYILEFRKRNTEFKQKQKAQFDHQHRVLEQDVNPDGTEVWITSESDTIPGTVVSAGENLRSYIVETPTGQVQRNRSHFNVAPESNNETSDTQSSSNVSTPPRTIMTHSRIGTTVNPPDQLD